MSMTIPSAPTINPATGALTYTAAANVSGTATYSVTLSDNGSGVAPNVNTSAAQSFTITVIAAADAPILTVASANISGGQGTNIPLGITLAQLVDQDGSETLAVTVTVPASNAGLTTIVGGTAPVHVPGQPRVWTIPLANVGTAAINQLSNSPPFDITITATSTETAADANPKTAATTRVVNVTIINTPPDVQLTDVVLLGDSVFGDSPINVVPGLPVTLTFTSNEPATFVLDWGDDVGLSFGQTFVPGEEISFTYVFGSFGSFQPVLTVTDADGGVTVLGDDPQGEPDEIPEIASQKIITAGGTLFVGGADSSDRIILSSGSGGVIVRMNNVASKPQSVGSRVVVFGNGGNDTNTTPSKLAFPVELYGGDAND
jgi:hypothetical protein